VGHWNGKILKTNFSLFLISLFFLSLNFFNISAADTNDFCSKLNEEDCLKDDKCIPIWEGVRDFDFARVFAGCRILSEEELKELANNKIFCEKSGGVWDKNFVVNGNMIIGCRCKIGYEFTPWKNPSQGCRPVEK